MEEGLIGVIVPAYKVEKFITQTYADFHNSSIFQYEKD